MKTMAFIGWRVDNAIQSITQYVLLAQPLDGYSAIGKSNLPFEQQGRDL